MKLVFASDSFKGTVTSGQTIEMLTKAANEVFGPCETVGVPVADGGEGTTEAVILARKGEKIYADVHGPLMEMAQAYYGRLSDSEAVLEMAQASGLPVVVSEGVPPETRLTEEVRVLRLSDGEEAWAACVLECARKKISREAGADRVRAAGFDVRSGAQLVGRAYQ